MKKFTLLILLLSSFLFGKTIDATYKISYGIFGELGLATTTLKILPNNKYHIKVHAYATGLAKFLSANKEEFYESSGTIVNNIFMPESYKTLSKNDNKSRQKNYTFDHSKNEVRYKQITKKLHTRHDAQLNPIKEWKEESLESKTNYYAANDLLSLFFNISNIIPNFDKGNEYKLKAIGANKQDGKLDLIIPNDERYKILEDTLGDFTKKFIVIINQKIFSSSRGELLISLNEKGFCNKAVLKDVLVFGDIKGEMVKFNIIEG